MTDYDIVVAGAGIVGVSTALHAQMRGHRVLLADPNPPGSGTSSGNACTIATYGCMPINDPAVFGNLTKLMFGKDSPLSVSIPHALRNPRWMLSFLANCRTAKSRAIAGHLAHLLSHAEAGLNPLIVEAGAEDLFAARGQLSIWSSRAGFDGARSGLEFRRQQGIPFTEMSGDEAKELEPGLDLPIERAIHYHQARHVSDPQELVRRMHARFTQLGGQTRPAKVSATRAHGDLVEVEIDGDTLTTNRAVIAAGAFARQIAGAGTAQLPLGVERGYHLLYTQDAHRVTRPVGWMEGGFYATPMAQGLRLAGTVEIARLDAGPNQNSIDYLARRATQMFQDLPQHDNSWLGYRPTMPDSMPVIGYSPHSDRIVHAFGHQHLGLTLGGITGRIVTDLIEDRAPNFAISAYSPSRSFGPFANRSGQ